MLADGFYAKVYDWDNLLVAYQNAARGKRGKNAVAHYELNLGDELIQLQHALRDQSYQPGAYESFYIHEPKKRLILAAPFRDRVAHHALCNVITPYFEQHFHPNSFANRVGKGTHAALDECQRLTRRFAYVLPCDVCQYFPSIDHTVLQRTLARLLPASPPILGLIARILHSGSPIGCQGLARVGLPIGNLTSQWWANCYLNDIDWFVTRQLRCKGYVRYVDDLLLFSDNKAELLTWRSALIERMARLRLTLHETRAQPRPVTEGVPFLGFAVFPSHRRLKRRKGLHFVRKLRARLRDYGPDSAAIRDSVTGWINYVRYADTWGLRRSVLARADLLAK